MPDVVTANRLRSGAVVYLKRDGTWVDQLTDAGIAETAADLAHFKQLALSAVARCDVTAVYAFGVRQRDGRPEPTSVRERLRALHAPSTAPAPTEDHAHVSV